MFLDYKKGSLNSLRTSFYNDPSVKNCAGGRERTSPGYS